MAHHLNERFSHDSLSLRFRITVFRTGIHSYFTVVLCHLVWPMRHELCYFMTCMLTKSWYWARWCKSSHDIGDRLTIEHKLNILTLYSLLMLYKVHLCIIYIYYHPQIKNSKQLNSNINVPRLLFLNQVWLHINRIFLISWTCTSLDLW